MAIHENFPTLTHLLCHFHILKGVDTRLNMTDLSKGFKDEIYEVFKEAVYTDSEEKFLEAQEYLCALGKLFVNFPIYLYNAKLAIYLIEDDGLGEYFDSRWFDNEPSVHCNSCQQWMHWKCENLKTNPKESVYKCTQCRGTN